MVRMGERRNTFTGLVGKPEWKSPLARPSHRWQNNIQMNPEEVRREGVLDICGSGKEEVLQYGNEP